MNPTQMLVLVAGAALLLVVRYLVFHRWPDVFWRDLADITHISYHRRGLVSDPHLTGTYNGYQLTIDNFIGYSRSLRTYTRIRLRIDNPAHLDFLLYETEAGSTLSGLPTGERVLTGETEFDNRFVLKGNPARQLADLFPQTLRRRWLRLQPFDLRVIGHELHYRHFGLDRDLDYLVLVLNVVTELARSLDTQHAVS